MSPWCRLGALMLVALVPGCAELIAQGNLDRAASTSAERPFEVAAADFEPVDTASPAALRAMHTSSDGSVVIRDALIVNPGLRAFFGAHGYPNYVQLRRDGLLQFIYLALRQVALVKPKGGDPPEVVDVQALTDDERERLDRDVRRRLEMTRMRAVLAALDHTWRVFSRMRNVTPNLPSSEPGIEMVLLKSSIVSRGIFYVPDNVSGPIIAWVAPDTRAAKLLKSGDVVTAVEGWQVGSETPPPQPTSPPPSDLQLTVWRQGASYDLRVPLEPRLPVTCMVSSDSTPNAFATRDSVIVNLGLVDLTENDDDLLAAVLGHELGHLSAGHTQPKMHVTDVLALTVIIPVELLLPGVGHAAIAAAHAPFDRDQEREADRIGIEIARQAGYDPAGMARMLERLAAATPPETEGGFFATHPSFSERIATARNAISQSAAQQ